MTNRGGKQEIALTVNGEPKTVYAYPMARLLDILRQDLGLTGTKEGCGEGECGACSVLVDDVLTVSCLLPAAQARGANVVTIEGITADHRFPMLQEKFLECGAAQCGICTPGMILASVHLLAKKPRPTIEEIREGLAGNICRCTGYLQIVESVAQAARHSSAR
jgi:aerobic carbon-monoxide dehydrogenase small subunit